MAPEYSQFALGVAIGISLVIGYAWGRLHHYRWSNDKDGGRDDTD